MKAASFVFVILFAVSSAMCMELRSHGERRSPDIVVGALTGCPLAKFTSVQAAVDAANEGDVIRVCAGLYQEQVVVTKPLTIRGDNGAIVMPNSVTANATGMATGEPIAAVILVQNTRDVTIEGLIVDGTDNGIRECSPVLIGILYQNASGFVQRDAVRGMMLDSDLSGCQSGDGIDVQSSPGRVSSVTVEANSVHLYQKNGITANEVGTKVAITGNAVTGVGPTPGAAQNGIQIGFGAAGIIERNKVTDNSWSFCISAEQCQFNATGVLVFQSDEILVSQNIVAGNQAGVFISGQKSKVENNDVFNSQIPVGIELAGDTNEVYGNRITNSDQIGILVQGKNNQVIGNELTEAGIGILEALGSTGTILSENRYFATSVQIQDPPPEAGTVSPVRW